MEQTELEKNGQTPEETPAPETSEPAEAPEAAAQEETPERSFRQIFEDVMEIAETMMVSIFVVLLVATYLTRPVTVQGKSMFPTLHNQDKLVMFRLLYQPKAGDIVVVNNYHGNIFNPVGDVVDSGYGLNELIIKRVIAVSGDKLEIDASQGAVYINDVKQDEPYINELTLSDDRAFTYPITIPEGYIFVMGDNRNHSTDSRSSSVGLVKKENVLGKAYFRYKGAEDDVTKEKSSIGFVG